MPDIVLRTCRSASSAALTAPAATGLLPSFLVGASAKEFDGSPAALSDGRETVGAASGHR